MTHEQFDALVEKLERFAHQEPASYRFRVGLLAALGYAYLILILVGLLGLVALLVSIVLFSHQVNALMIKLGALLLIPVWVIVRSLWVSFPPPQGISLSRQQVPQLFALVDELTTKLQAPQFHHILLDRNFNAAVVQVPKLGVFGWHQNYLLVGLPLMQALSVEQFRAVVAHELGHLSGNHSRFAGWIYRVRKTWMQIFERFQDSQHGSSVLFDRFFNWYAPFFGAYSFVLARMNEYEADRCAVEVAGNQHIAEALIAVEVKSKFLETSFWAEVYKQAEDQADPPAIVYSNLRTALRDPIPTERSSQWLQQALIEKTSNADTHPCLGDRLKAVGYLASEKTLPNPVQVSAADQLLGEMAQQYAAQFDKDWSIEVSTPWRQRYASLQESRQQLEDLEQRARIETLPLEEFWTQTVLTLEIKGKEIALPMLQKILQRDDTYWAAHYTLGQLLLEEQNESGVAHLETAIAQNSNVAVDAYQSLYTFFWRRGDTERAKAYQTRLEQHYELMTKAQRERSGVSESDRLVSQSLSPSEVEALCETLAAHPHVKEAYLVQKEVTYFPERTFCVLGIVQEKNFMGSGKLTAEQFDQLVNALQFPVQAWIVILNQSGNGKLEKRFRQVDKALIYSK
ncbi:M48 family metalloprotease [Phormidesmis sp. 146-35]